MFHLKTTKKNTLLIAIFLLTSLNLFAQSTSGFTTGLEAARLALSEYFTPIANVSMIIGGLVAMIGAIRIFQKWNSGDHNMNKELLAWGGSAVFLVVAPIVIRSVFSI